MFKFIDYILLHLRQINTTSKKFEHFFNKGNYMKSPFRDILCVKFSVRVKFESVALRRAIAELTAKKKSKFFKFFQKLEMLGLQYAILQVQNISNQS